jgi:hypothetical protein
VSIDTVEAEIGSQIAIPIRLSNNDEPISAISIPLWKANPFLKIDSISFVGSILPSNFDGWIQPPGMINDTVKISLVGNWESPTPTISAIEGVLATIHITVSPSAVPGVAVIDSFHTVDTFYSEGGHMIVEEQEILASDASGLVVFSPEFIPGAVIMLSPTDVDDDVRPSGLPEQYTLAQNYPNPFNPATTIEYSLPQADRVKLEVFNVLGQRVSMLVNEWKSAGVHRVTFDAAALPSGVYFYRFSYSQGVATKKMTLLK